MLVICYISAQVAITATLFISHAINNYYYWNIFISVILQLLKPTPVLCAGLGSKASSPVQCWTAGHTVSCRRQDMGGILKLCNLLRASTLTVEKSEILNILSSLHISPFSNISFSHFEISGRFERNKDLRGMVDLGD